MAQWSSMDWNTEKLQIDQFVLEFPNGGRLGLEIRISQAAEGV